MSYDLQEQAVVLHTFTEMLRAVTKDGGVKRARAEKPPWWKDTSHLVAIFSHLYKWFRGDKKDADSGEHPFVHLAWRALAIAYQETHGCVDPAMPRDCIICGRPHETDNRAEQY